ncbi:hypothetical protein [Peptoniphilus grossensis]|uniref:Uncharacterized protein n=1 Tax=Peptoniphilus grossensis TaxID=1465756 RepID=A0ABU7XBZ8_9FIRM
MNISFTNQIVSRDKSEPERPSSTALNRNNGVVVGLSVSLAFLGTSSVFMFSPHDSII